MGTLRQAAASVVAASAVLLTGQPGVATADAATTSQGPEQGFRAAADIAADLYRDERRSILQAYRNATRTAESRLETAVSQAQTPAQRHSAWRHYAHATAMRQHQAHAELQAARARFRNTVDDARVQFGLNRSAG
ncbi:MAG: hypothetical protein R2720_02115 [Candidatus Nanopelagicales bacterium]